MVLNDEQFLRLKRKTFSALLTKSDDINKLIRSLFVISLCHDKCIKDEKEQVCLQFINDCATKINLVPNLNLDFKTKFSLIRNKLAHGDYAYDSDRRVIVFKYLDDYVEVSLNDIVTFANSISNYYSYLNKEYPRETLIIYDGKEVLATDYCKKRRDYSYNRRFEKYKSLKPTFHNLTVNRIYFPEDDDTKKKIHFEDSYMKIDYLILGKTNEQNKTILNPYGDKLLNNMLSLLNDDKVLNEEYKEACEMLFDYYIFYIYPLENFMKTEDQGIKSLPNKDNIDFSSFDLSTIRNEETYEEVGKIKNYPVDLLGLYKKISELEIRLDSLSQWKNKDEKYKNTKLSLENEINDLLKLTLSEPIKRLYDYSKNRSLIEHIRCSIMHGNYTFDISNNTFVFYDKWKENEVYRDIVKLEDFKMIFNFDNIELVMEQDRKVNRKRLLR